MVEIGFIKMDINLKLIFIILLLIIAVTGFSVFYQNRLESISTDYKNKTKQLEKVTAKAVSEQSKAEQLFIALN